MCFGHIKCDSRAETSRLHWYRISCCWSKRGWITTECATAFGFRSLATHWSQSPGVFDNPAFQAVNQYGHRAVHLDTGRASSSGHWTFRSASEHCVTDDGRDMHTASDAQRVTERRESRVKTEHLRARFSWNELHGAVSIQSVVCHLFQYHVISFACCRSRIGSCILSKTPMHSCSVGYMFFAENHCMVAHFDTHCCNYTALQDNNNNNNK